MDVLYSHTNYSHYHYHDHDYYFKNDIHYTLTLALTDFQEYLKGAPLVDLEGIQRYTSNPEATLITALRTWALSVAENDVFHADVHGGNLLVLEDGRIGFLDFGIVGKFSEKVRTALGGMYI
jgi:aarF domain-containing kinase